MEQALCCSGFTTQISPADVASLAKPIEEGVDDVEAALVSPKKKKVKKKKKKKKKIERGDDDDDGEAKE